MNRFIQFFFEIPAPVALAAVFLLTCAEAALFFGFVIPGEIAVVLGGVLASRNSVQLGSVIAAAVGGAILGDFVGFSIGRRYGSAFLERRFPRKWPGVRAWIDRCGAPAVFFGRSTAFLRAVVPTAAGAARMSPWRFLLWNVLGGVAWGTAFSLLGYFAGEGYEAVLRWAGRGSIAVTILIVALIVAYLLKRWLDRRLTGGH
ncbi:MAG TPA: DedA family protein [Thermoanaerobaculia bacterium]|nr:DedA family protein [Thermoanaerobaculia bacterium]